MAGSAINFLDIGIIAVLFLFIFIGIMRGFTSDFLGLFTWVGAFFTTTKLFPYGEYLARKVIHNIFFADLLAAFLIFIISLIILVAFVKSIADAVHKSMLSGIDRSLGIVSGFFRGSVLLTVAYMIALMFWKPGEKPAIVQNARLEPFLASNARLVNKYLIPDCFLPPKLLQHLYGKEYQAKEKTPEELVKCFSSPQPAQQNKDAQDKTGKDIKPDSNATDSPPKKK